MEKERKKVKKVTYLTEYACDECGASVESKPGFGSAISDSFGTDYAHECTGCHKYYSFRNKTYPIVEDELVIT